MPLPLLFSNFITLALNQLYPKFHIADTPPPHRRLNAFLRLYQVAKLRIFPNRGCLGAATLASKRALCLWHRFGPHTPPVGKREQSKFALKPEFSALFALVALAKSYLAASAKHQNHLKIKALEFSEFLR